MKKKSKQKRQNRRQSVVAGRQQLYCAVQSRSPNRPNHRQTTTEKVVFTVQLATERRQRRCIPDRWRQAVPQYVIQKTDRREEALRVLDYIVETWTAQLHLCGASLGCTLVRVRYLFDTLNFEVYVGKWLLNGKKISKTLPIRFDGTRIHVDVGQIWWKSAASK